MPVSPVVSRCQLALRAGKIARGDALIPSIQSRKAKLVICSQDCGENRKKKVKDKTSSFSVPLEMLPAELFDQINPGISGAFAVTDAGFAKSIQTAITQIRKVI